ncbi:hypothetical protein Aspvir_000373 [Aspergillus viridinutans]|uniref:Uncharacterized protein n=1 Tax=Aspergillus viridinutans TaxID=75553 RepID=A0A9P3F1Q8_ASPVI|nr:uncharacterized protein Aspvir_000373 [Aspergillus viridinutans]GIJ98257.1 hypothetical protein Aspvir_000373 [Aspergillus viridinutans]
MTSQLDDSFYENCPPQSQIGRTSFGAGPGTSVYGWPSKGGLYVLQSYDGVELGFLQLDRFNSTIRSQDPAEEDAHCANMRKLGAPWFESEEAFILSALQHSRPHKQVLFAGWPSTGGVWVLKTTYAEASSRGLGGIKNALNMEERCQAIERLGGSFYADPKDCRNLDL